ncbi:MAG: hypothetical protein M1820_002861 [Bogoriella megaspora]|nr:MAG: hypothetical protein M1820_002861 [Bogoriella megaspora]
MDARDVGASREVPPLVMILQGSAWLGSDVETEGEPEIFDEDEAMRAKDLEQEYLFGFNEVSWAMCPTKRMNEAEK